MNLTNEDRDAFDFIEHFSTTSGAVLGRVCEQRQKMIYGDRSDADRMGRWIRLRTPYRSFVRAQVAKRVMWDEQRAASAGVYL